MSASGPGASCQPLLPGCRGIGMARPLRKPRVAVRRTPGPLNTFTRLTRVAALMLPTREAESLPGPSALSPGTMGLPLQVGSMTGVLPPGSTVAEGECFAIARLCSRFEAEADCTTDCRVATSQQNKALRPWPWAQAHGKERLAQLCWTRSHTTEPQHAEEFGAHSSWRRAINAIADVACGEAVKEALRDHPAWDPEEADDLAREVSQYLQRKVEVLLTSVERPPWEEREAAPPPKKPLVSSKAAKRQPNQNRPAANGGPNKRERIRTMVAAGSGGHDWVITSENKNNLLASCRRCTLFVQQVHKPAVFDRIEAHPCLGREQPVPEGAGVHPSHNMANVGRAWICKHCFIQLWVAYEKIPQGVAQQCRPSRKQARGRRRTAGTVFANRAPP